MSRVLDLVRAGVRWPVLYPDCPWLYDNPKSQDPAMGGFQYPPMSTEDLCRLPVGRLGREDSVCFMWATEPKKEEAYRVMRAWGYTPVTTPFVWVKLNRAGRVVPAHVDGQSGPLLLGGVYSGLGHWTNGNVEVCIMGRRGRVTRAERDVKQVVFAPVGAHSRKPPEVRDRISDLMGWELPKLELFARDLGPVGQRWDATGLDYDGLDIRDLLGVPVPASVEPGPVDLVYADPPWRMKYHSETKGKSAANTHPCMTLDDMQQVGNWLVPLLAKRANLAMWVIDPMLPEADALAASWGFPRKVTRLFSWVKLTRNGHQWHRGTGYHTQANPEDCILYTREAGGLPVNKAGKPERLVVAPVGVMSAKPAEVRRRLETIYPATCRVEVFSRQPEGGVEAWPGWKAFLGNEVSGLDIREDLARLAANLGIGYRPPPA